MLLGEPVADHLGHLDIIFDYQDFNQSYLHKRLCNSYPEVA
jgi:hypothetical protein